MKMEERKETLRKMKICRFCFNSTEKELVNIYQKELKTVPLPIQIMSCASIEVFANDGLPQLICNSCKQQTNESYIFKSNCKKADDALKNFLQTGELIKPNIRGTVQKTAQKRPISKISPVKDIKIVSKASNNEPMDVKKMKLDDGTEIITLCISQTEETPVSQDESSQESEEIIKEPSVEEVGELEDDELFDEAPAFKRPEKPERVKTDIFSCDKCDKTFPLLQLLTIHLEKHNKTRPHPCLICDKEFYTKYDLQQHQQTHSNVKQFACSICQKEFARQAELRRHEATGHRDTPNYMCSECEKIFLVKEDLEYHMRKHDKTKPFSCDTCKKSFVFKQGLERHISSVHAMDKSYKCNYCETSFSTPIRLARHVTTHAGLRPYPCKVCGRTFLMSHHLTRHMRSHYLKQPEEVVGQHKCDVCSMSFRRKDSLINHSTIHSMVNLKCVICNTKFDSAKAVKDHITTHLQGLPFPCEKCDYSFDTETQLIEHVVKHAEMEYEEQIEKEVISEGNKKGKSKRTGRLGKETKFEAEEAQVYEEEGEEGEEEALHYEEEEEEEEHLFHEEQSVTTFHIPDINDPSSLIPSKYQQSTNLILENTVEDIMDPSAQNVQTEEIHDDGLKTFFKSEMTDSEEEGESQSPDAENEVHCVEGRDIKPIYRVEGTKMYQRKGPIQRKIPIVETQNIETVTLDEINEPPSMAAVPAESLSNLPVQKPVNVKVGDKVVKVQKFIISKEEMKNMAKLGFLEVKNGQVIMKTPGKPILNATIKPVGQSDIENLIHSQKTQSMPPVKQYQRKRKHSNVPENVVDSIIEDFV